MTLQSDLHIPPVADIIARALDIRASAVRLGDTQAIDQIDRLIAKLPHARLCWKLGVLVVTSPSGNDYHVWSGGCDCTNGRFHKGECWHWALYNLLLDMLQTAADSADDESLLDEAAALIEQLDAIHGDCDFEADCDESAPRAWKVGALFGKRLAAVRSAYA